MRLLLVLWSFFIFVCTCTKDQDAFVRKLRVRFDWNPDARLSDFFINDMMWYSLNWTLFKVGHFTLFAVLEALAGRVFRKPAAALGFTLGMAALSELLQLYFYRDGRLYDIAVDASGALAMFAVLRFFGRRSRSLRSSRPYAGSDR